ncbi:outer membrane pore protein E [Klebsiella michiganensis]|uniref:Outer membrane pore protein E n=1 Tax=Klebsiella michiganensis TaxID=1134687 RepID=A0A7H4PKK6_9ENTR|nr:outer membrane pore protein E [Klebsiella michiganensis]
MAMRIKVKTSKFIPAMFLITALFPALGWFQSRGKDIENSGDIYLMKYLDINLSWFLNKNFFTYVDYKINQLDKNTPFSISTDDTFGVGMTWQF